MDNRIDRINKKAKEIVEQKENLTEHSIQLSDDLEDVRALLVEPLLDEDDVNAESYLEESIDSDLDTVTSELQDNNAERVDALEETDEYISSLEENLKTLEEMRSVSDLGASSKENGNTERRLDELRAIRVLLEGEDSSIDNSGAVVDALLSDNTGDTDFRERNKVEVEQTKHETFHGIHFSNVNLSNEYKKTLDERLSSAEKNAKNVFDIAAQKGMINVKDAAWYDKPHYHPANGKDERGIYYNADVDELNLRGRGKGAVFFHETGHMIDHAFGNGEFISSSNSFRKALKEDASMILEKYNSNPKWAEGFKDMIMEDDTAHSISDIIEGITYGEISGKYGHMSGNANYWNLDKYRVCNECFAHFFEASMGGGNVTIKAKGKIVEISKIDRLKLFFPNTYREFDKILNYIDAVYNSDPRQRVRGVPDER